MMIDDKLAARSAAPELPVLRLQRASRLGPVTFGLLLGLLVFAAVLLPPFALGIQGDALAELTGAALFFALSCGVIGGCTGPVFRGAAADFAALAPVLPLPEQDRALVGRALSRVSGRELLGNSLAGLACALLHLWIMGTPRQPLAYALPNATGTLLLWVLMFWTVPGLISNAALFSRLGGVAAPDLLRPSRHAPFGRAALRPALFIIALLCAYGLLVIGDGGGLSGPTLIGFGACLASLIGLFFLPLRGIRQRIEARREATLAELDARLEGLHRDELARASVEELFELDALLDIRERVAAASPWPLDLAGVRRILLYIVLPPLTWAAAALVEMGIGHFL